jgi:transposase InsO family protein
MHDDERRKMALWRFSILGALVSARLEHGDRQALLNAAAARVHHKPDGRLVELSARTLEDWYYRYQKGGLAALQPQPRSDQGHSRAVTPAVAELVVRCKRERPRRSIRRIIRMLERAKVVLPGVLSHSSVHRLLQAQGLSAQPKVGPDAERRSFLHEHSGDLWVGDALHLHKPVLGPDGKECKAYLVSVIDGATRMMVHSELTLSEGAVVHERILKEALLKHGRPRVYYVDRGSAYVAGSLQAICAQVGIRLLHTEAQDPEAKGVIERWHRTWRAEVEQELGDVPLPMAQVAAKHWAWLAAEYHVRVHDTTQRAPLAHFLSEVEHLRALPRGLSLDEVFVHREQRHVRKDGTVRFQGRLLEVRPELVGRKVELRFDPTQEASLPKVFVKDRFFCDTVLRDRHFNASRPRRRGLGQAAPGTPPSGLDPLALIEAEHYQRVGPWPDPPSLAAPAPRRSKT